MTTHVFKDDLKRGNVGENLLLDTYSFFKFDGCNAHDVIDTRDGKTVEIKTDFYDMYKTENFFMEKWSNDIDFKLGGPYRTEEYKTDIYLYQFIKNKIIFWFDDVSKLVNTIDEHVKKHNLRPISVKNRGYNTLGYKIPRTAVMDLFEIKKLGEALPEPNDGN